MSNETGNDDSKKRFAIDLNKLRDDFEARFHKHLVDGDPIAAMEARLLARLVETRQFDEVEKWAIAYEGSLEMRNK